MRLFELDPNNPIDKELEKTANDVDRNGSLDQNDIDAQGEAPPDGPIENDPMGGTEEPPMVSDAPEISTPTDSALLSRVQGNDYVQNYDHSDVTSPSHPLVIMDMDMSDLSQLRNKIRIHLDSVGLSSRGGVYDNTTAQAASDMLSFVDIVMAYKKMAVRTRDTNTGKRPPIKQQPTSKTKAGKQFKAKRN